MPIFAQSSASDTYNSSDTDNSSDINLNGADRSHLPVSPEFKIEGASSLPVNSAYSFPEIRAGMSIETGSSDRLYTPDLGIANEKINSPAFIWSGKRKSAPPPAGAGIYRAPTLSYWVVTGAVFSSNIAANELMQGCLAAHSCLSIPGPMRSRAAMYEVGLGSAGFTNRLGQAGE